MHVMATNAPHVLDRLNLDANRKVGVPRLSSDLEKLCGLFRFVGLETARIALGGRRPAFEAG
jgi:hypothetical protein